MKMEEKRNEAPAEKISIGAERQRRYRAVRKLRSEPTEERLWEVLLLYSGVCFKTYSGLTFTYEIRKGRNGQYTKELWIDRREKSKSLAWSSVLLALRNIKNVGEDEIRNGENYSVLAYAASSNPRLLLRSVEKAVNFKANSVMAVFREFYREEIWSEQSLLAEKYLTIYKLLKMKIKV